MRLTQVACRLPNVSTIPMEIIQNLSQCGFHKAIMGT